MLKVVKSNKSEVFDMEMSAEERELVEAKKAVSMAMSRLKKAQAACKDKSDEGDVAQQRYFLTTDKYYPVLRGINHDPRISKGYVIAVYTALQDAVPTLDKKRQDWAKIAIKSLCVLSKTNERSVKKALKELQDLGYIVGVESGKKTAELNEVNKYYLHTEPIEFELVDGSTLYHKIDEYMHRNSDLVEGLDEVHFRWLRNNKANNGGDGSGFILNPAYHKENGELINDSVSVNKVTQQESEKEEESDFIKKQKMIYDALTKEPPKTVEFEGYKFPVVGENVSTKKLIINVDHLKEENDRLFKTLRTYSAYDDFKDFANRLKKEYQIDTSKPAYSYKKREPSQSKANDAEKAQKNKPLEEEQPKYIEFEGQRYQIMETPEGGLPRININHLPNDLHDTVCDIRNDEPCRYQELEKSARELLKICEPFG